MLIRSIVECLLTGNGRLVDGIVHEIQHEPAMRAFLGVDQRNVLALLELGFDEVLALLLLGLADADEVVVVTSVEAEFLFCGVVHCCCVPCGFIIGGVEDAGGGC